MTLTLRFALQFAFAAALTVALAVGASFALFALRIDDTAGAMRDSLSSALESRLRAESARALEQAVAATENALAAGDRMALMAAAMEARLTGPAETVRLYGPDGRALADGAGDPSAFERPAPAPVRGARLEDGVRTWRDGGMLYSGRAVCPDGDCVGLVVVAVDASEATEAQAEADDALEEAKSALWLMGAGLVVLAVLAGAAISGSIGSALARRFSRSMEAAVDALEKISAGETGVSVPTRDAHLADLAHAVDMVAVAMAEATAKGETPEQSPFIADIPDGLFVAALSGEMLVANPALHALFGAEDGSLAGADVFETFGAERVEGAEAMSEALRTIGAITRPDGATVPVVLSVRPTGGGEDMRVVGVAREADPQPAIDPEAFAEAEKRAEAAKEAKEKFLSVMSHELRTPLNGILGGAAVLAGTELSDSQRGFLSLVQNSGSRMLALVTDILDYSRSEGDAPSPLHAAPAALEHLAQEIADGVSKDAAAKGLDLYVRVQPGLPPVLADVEAVLGIGEQFAQNAVKFTETGHVGVEITHRPADDGRLEISLAVDDSGPGVSVEIQKTMFDAFAMGDDSARRATGGTGLGLSIAQRLAKRLGGEIHVATAARGGSTFRVDFTVRTDGPAPPLSAALSGVRAVIVDETAGARTRPRRNAALRRRRCRRSGRSAGGGAPQGESAFRPDRDAGQDAGERARFGPDGASWRRRSNGDARPRRTRRRRGAGDGERDADIDGAQRPGARGCADRAGRRRSRGRRRGAGAGNRRRRRRCGARPARGPRRRDERRARRLSAPGRFRGARGARRHEGGVALQDVPASTRADGPRHAGDERHRGLQGDSPPRESERVRARAHPRLHRQDPRRRTRTLRERRRRRLPRQAGAHGRAGDENRPLARPRHGGERSGGDLSEIPLGAPERAATRLKRARRWR
jgi:signal transduction histidine kinase